MTGRLHLGDDIREVAHGIGRVVALRVEREPELGMITGYLVDADGVLYRVRWASGADSFCYAMELVEALDP